MLSEHCPAFVISVIADSATPPPPALSCSFRRHTHEMVHVPRSSVECGGGRHDPLRRPRAGRLVVPSLRHCRRRRRRGRVVGRQQRRNALLGGDRSAGTPVPRSIVLPDALGRTAWAGNPSWNHFMTSKTRPCFTNRMEPPSSTRRDHSFRSCRKPCTIQETTRTPPQPIKKPARAEQMPNRMCEGRDNPSSTR